MILVVPAVVADEKVLMGGLDASAGRQQQPSCVFSSLFQPVADDWHPGDATTRGHPSRSNQNYRLRAPW